MTDCGDARPLRAGVVDRVAETMAQHKMAGPDHPVLLMVSGGSDSTAMAYIMADLRERAALGPLAMLHVNHRLRGEASEGDAVFAGQLAEALEIPFFLCDIDIASIVESTGANMEAVAREERYRAARESLESLCRHVGAPVSSGRIFAAHTQDDRVESFFMRSIVGTGPGGFRAMRYENGPVRRPCLDVSREALRDYISQRQVDAASDGDVAVVHDESGRLWREDATNAHTDRFRSYVRHTIVPAARERNPQLLDTLCRTMNLIADEDDMLDAQAQGIVSTEVKWEGAEDGLPDYKQGCVVSPLFGAHALPLRRRVATKILRAMLPEDARIETASVESIMAAYTERGPVSGYTDNIQGNLALSANKQGLRIEPMASYRARRKK